MVGLEAFRDHHRYRPGEIDTLRERARAGGAELVTTEKDLARLGIANGLAALRIEVFVERAAALVDRVRALARGSAA